MTASVASNELPSVLLALREAVSQRLGPRFGVASTGVDGDPHALYPEELAAIQKAIPRRQREFAAGRQAARQAMAQIGWPPAAIASAPDRSPVWPDGLAGSISHTSQACMVVVGPGDDVGSIGIDLEDNRPMDPALWQTICTPEEQSWALAQPASQQGVWVTRMFCAKEAFYKWQFPQTGQMLDFHDVQVNIDTSTMSFDVLSAPGNDVPLLTYQQPGQLLTTDTQILAMFVGPFII